MARTMMDAIDTFQASDPYTIHGCVLPASRARLIEMLDSAIRNAADAGAIGAKSAQAEWQAIADACRAELA